MIICNTLEDVRSHIDVIDSEIVALLARRSHFVREAARLKRDRSEIVVPARIEQIIAKVRREAVSLNVDPDLMERIYKNIIEAFIWHEGEVWQVFNHKE
ncbi:MAG: chorismate mutase [Alphaproteobacteria bacterium]